MDIKCPSCRSTIPIDDINVSTDLALCRTCGRTFRFSEIVDQDMGRGVDLASPPPGTWYEQLPDGFTVGATTQSWIALFLIPFTCVWSGGSMYGIYGTQIRSGHFSLFPSLFGVPFFLGTCGLVTMCLMLSAGKVSITKSADRLYIFAGVGWLGITRNYAWSDFRSVREGFGGNSYNFNRQQRTLALEGKRRITVGSMWSENRRYFVLCVVRSQLAGTALSPGFTVTNPKFR
jgi:hypothetical protein